MMKKAKLIVQELLLLDVVVDGGRLSWDLKTWFAQEN